MNVVRGISLCVSCLLWGSVLSPGQTIISEFLADNKNGLVDEDGDDSDWIELYNTSNGSVNLFGWSLTGDPSHQTRWSLPSTNLPAKGFMVVFASGKNRAVPGKPLHTDFSLRAAGEYLALLKPDATVATEFAPAYPQQYPDISYGLAQNVTTNTLVPAGAQGRVLIPTAGTLGASWIQAGFNDAAWMAGRTGIGYETAVPGFAVYNYVANVGICSLAAAQELIKNSSQQLAVFQENAPVINYVNTEGSAHYGSDRTFPGLMIGADQENFAIHATGTLTIPAPGNWTFGVNSDDGFELWIGSDTMSYPNPRSPGDTLQTFNFPVAGDYDIDLVFYECGGGSEVELYAAQGNYGSWDATHFRLVGDVANGGLSVTAPVVAAGTGGTGYRSLIQTDIQTAMQQVNASVYIRIPFSVSEPTAVQSLTLRMMYDDGFVAYLNGREIARRNAPASPQWNSAATASHPSYEAVQFEEINVTEFLSALQAGNNVLAIQGLNQAATDTDFLIRPELVEYKASATTTQYFATPTPGRFNSSGFVAFVADTKFSVKRGFYDAPFSVAISTATEQATIVYTTNGSVPTLSNGTVYTGPLTISGTTVLRAAAFREGFQPSNVDTQTYIFVQDVLRQSPNGQPPAGWPSSWGNNTVDYGMDPNIVNAPAYSGEIAEDLKSIPTYSIVTDLKNLFDPGTGIYANPSGDGIEWERPASVELIYPDGAEGFQIDAGLRIRGGYSRSTGNPKHAFRLFFRQEYGDAKLVFPAFASQGGAETFDSFDLRTFQNYSWSFEGDARCIGLRDQFSRDTQLAQGQPGERGDFYHLYINGQYWGVYNTAERPEASFGESYFGGRKEDYDVIKVDTGAGYTIHATDGNLEAWTRLWKAATNGFSSDADYFKVQGLNIDGTVNPAYENLLDVDNLIDYMLVIFFTGNIDAPISAFLGNNNPNNLYAVRNRTGQYGGFRFLAHDSEHTLLHESSLGNNDELHRDRTGPFAAGDPTRQGASAALARSNPQYIFTRLTQNAEFRLRVADHVQRQFFNGGVFTAEGCRARFLARSNEIYRAMVCESARWGDAKREPPRNRDVDWVREMNRVYGDYFNQRPGIVLNQLKAKSLYPDVAAPSFSQMGGQVQSGFQLVMSAPAGTVYYTRDGSDPRLRGGQVSSSALVYNAPIALTQSAVVKARVLNGSTWSALVESPFYVIQNFKDLLITEIMYHPPAAAGLDGDEFEFVELKNVAGTPLELSGVRFTSGIQYTFPIGSFIAPGQFIVLVRNPVAFASKYPGVRVDGVYTNGLSNNGETLTLAHLTGTPIFSVGYGTRPPWPELADGGGFSLTPVNPNFNPNPNDPLNWRASTQIGGSPGADEPASNVPRVLVNEVLTHTDPPETDTVELFNPNASPVDIGGWFLTDDRTNPRKFRIPLNTIIPAGGYILFDESQWDADPTSTNSFRLDSHGEQIYLFSADPSGALTGYSDGFAFGAAQNGVTFGRYTISTGEIQYPAQKQNTLGAPNAGPRIGPIVINEIHYRPPTGGDEFIELKSVTNGVVRLYDPLSPTNTWRVSGISFSFPPNVEVAPHSLLLLVSIDPATFRSKYSVPAGVPIFGPYAGRLQGGGEIVALQFPDRPDVDTNTGNIFIPFVDVDVVHYRGSAPWPTEANGLGASLEKRDPLAYGNDPASWRASFGPPSPGLENSGNRKPLVNAGLDRDFEITNAPVALTLSGTATDDGLPETPGALTVTWSQVSGPGPVWFDNPAQANATVFFPGSGTYVLRLTANDGALQATDDVTIALERPASTHSVSLVAKGAKWKYLDDGSNQGTAWVSPAFNDSSWKSGPAPLGYGDANGELPATTVSYGPNASSKYITTYFRQSFTVAKATSLTNLVVSVQRDDGVIVYLNGHVIFTDNLPNGADYLTTAPSAVGGSDETAFYSQAVDAAFLVDGTNVLAAEVHQSSGTSTDLVFDLELAAESLSNNEPPVVSAGADQNVTFPAAVVLKGLTSDDGLPVPPGLLTFAWSQVSGPGTVSFGNAAGLDTTAAFSAPGAYVLRLSVTDSAVSVADDVTVTVIGQDPEPIRIESADYSGGAAPVFRLNFTAQGGTSYTVQYCDSLSGGLWRKLADVPAPNTTQQVEVVDPGTTATPTRYYRIVSPQQP